MDDNGKAMVIASFIADSLALGTHWIYDTKRILDTFGRVDSLLKPASDSCHLTKEKGDFTHYGDQTLVLLESLAARKSFDLNDFSVRWRALFENYQGYIDGATHMTLSRYASGHKVEDAGSSSDDLAGGSRVAPLVYRYRQDLATLVDTARSQTRMTHNNPNTIDSAEFFGIVGWLVLNGMPPVVAMQTVAQDQFGNSSLYDWVKSGIQSKGIESVLAISRFGQSCHTEEALPGTVHLIAKYENDLKEALIQCVMAGGDSAARGMMVGMVLGAHLGPKSVPEEWFSQLRQKEHILELLKKLS